MGKGEKERERRKGKEKGKWESERRRERRKEKGYRIFLWEAITVDCSIYRVQLRSIQKRKGKGRGK